MENCTWNVHYKHTNTQTHTIAHGSSHTIFQFCWSSCCRSHFYYTVVVDAIIHAHTHSYAMKTMPDESRKKPHINLQPHVISRNATNSFSCVLIFISLGRRKKACHFYTEWLYKFTATPDGETMDRERLELLTSPMAQKTIFMYKRRYYATPSDE